MKQTITIIGTVCLLLILLLDQASGEVLIEVKERARVTGNEILLEDVAVVHTDDRYSGPDLKKLLIGRSPLPGQNATIKREQLQLALKSKKISMDEIEFLGPAETILVREKQILTADHMESLVREHILKNSSWPHKDLEIHGISGVRDLVLPKGVLQIQVTPQRDADYLGLTPFQIMVQTESGEQKQLWVKADIRVYKQVVVAKHPIARTREIGKDDVKVVKRNLADIPADAVYSVSEVVGKRTRRQIRTGDPIRLGAVEIAPVVRRGDLVTLKAEGHQLVITAQGKVLENGKPGEVIRIMNISSKREIYGKVIDGGTAEVIF